MTEKLRKTFAHQVNESFSFLVSNYNFTILKENQVIRYISKNIVFEIYYEDITYEFYINVVFNNNEEFYLDELLQHRIPSYKENKCIQITNTQVLRQIISEYSSLLEREYQNLFQNKKNLKEIIRMAIAQRKKFTEDSQQNEIRQKAISDWGKKDYSMVIADYNQIKNLSKLEKKRLIYSKKQIEKL